MKKARLIKKTEIAEQNSTAIEARQTRTPQQPVANLAQRTLSQWLKAQQDSRNQNPRAAFAALFIAEI